MDMKRIMNECGSGVLPGKKKFSMGTSHGTQRTSEFTDETDNEKTNAQFAFDLAPAMKSLLFFSNIRTSEAKLETIREDFYGNISLNRCVTCKIYICISVRLQHKSLYCCSRGVEG
jgi:hypothetical protein